jgi:hypothetical protein
MHDFKQKAAPVFSRLGYSDDSGVEEVVAQERRNDVNIRNACNDISIKDIVYFWKPVARRF